MERYDSDSGLVFKETVIKVPRFKDRGCPWEHRCKALDAPRPAGIESLYAKAMRVVTRNAHTLSVETLKDLPSAIVTRIWRVIRQEYDICYHVSARSRKAYVGTGTEKVFTSGECGHGDRTFVHFSHLSQQNFTKPLVDYFSYISSPTFEWMTDLLLGETQCTAGDLKQLYRLANLRRLQIRRLNRDNGGGSFGDGVLTYWASCARNAKAFAFLELLAIFSEPRITSESIECFGHFPMLQTVLLHDTSVKSKHQKIARQYGWSDQAEGGFSECLQTHRLKRTYDLAHSGGLQDMVDSLLAAYVAHERPQSGEYDDRPTLRVEFSPHGRLSFKSIRQEDVLLVFERERGLTTPPANQNDALPEANEHPDATSKRRRLKSGKAVQLDNLLATF